MGFVLRLGFFIADLLLLNVAILLSYSLFGVEVLGPERVNTIYLFVFSNLTWLFLVVVSNPYNVSVTWGLRKIIRSQLSFILIHLLVVTGLIILLRKSFLPQQLAVMYLIFVPTFFLTKYLTFYGTSFFSGKNDDVRRYIIIGSYDLAREIRRYFLLHSDLQHRYFGLIEPGIGEWSMTKVRMYCETHKINEIYCCLPEMTNSDIRRLVEFGMDAMIKVKLISDHRSVRQRALALEHYDHVPVFDITTIPLDDWRNQWLKRAFDMVFSALVAVFLLTWLIPLIGILIKLESNGPVFFKQMRSGRGNKPFFCVKFRTMIVNLEADTKQATTNDPRITKLGAFLRKTSLDEFPQFFNVIAGDMSVVGPRPHPIKLNEKFKPLINKYMIRHYVKPGVTGLAQVMGYRGETRLVRDMRNRIRLDRFYIENWSFYFDLKIVFKTAVSVITGDEKAY